MLPSCLRQVFISVVAVPDAPEIVFPTNSVVEEDGMLVVSGLGMYDADVSRPGDEDLLFDIWLDAVSGHLSLSISTVSLPESQACADETAIYWYEIAIFWYEILHTHIVDSGTRVVLQVHRCS